MLSAHNIIGASHCFEQWHYATCHNYSITDYRWTRQGPFWGHISARSFGALTVSQLASFTYEFRVEVIRGSAEIRRDPRDHFMLLLVYCGAMGFAQIVMEDVHWIDATTRRRRVATTAFRRPYQKLFADLGRIYDHPVAAHDGAGRQGRHVNV
jgi:hypothetical protein